MTRPRLILIGVVLLLYLKGFAQQPPDPASLRREILFSLPDRPMTALQQLGEPQVKQTLGEREHHELVQRCLRILARTTPDSWNNGGLRENCTRLQEVLGRGIALDADTRLILQTLLTEWECQWLRAGLTDLVQAIRDRKWTEVAAQAKTRLDHDRNQTPPRERITPTRWQQLQNDLTALNQQATKRTPFVRLKALIQASAEGKLDKVEAQGGWIDQRALPEEPRTLALTLRLLAQLQLGEQHPAQLPGDPASLRESMGAFAEVVARENDPALASLCGRLRQELGVQWLLAGHPLPARALLKREADPAHAAALQRDLRAVILGEGEVHTSVVIQALQRPEALKGLALLRPARLRATALPRQVVGPPAPTALNRALALEPRWRTRLSEWVAREEMQRDREAAQSATRLEQLVQDLSPRQAELTQLQKEWKRTLPPLERLRVLALLHKYKVEDLQAREKEALAERESQLKRIAARLKAAQKQDMTDLQRTQALALLLEGMDVPGVVLDLLTRNGLLDDYGRYSLRSELDLEEIDTQLQALKKPVLSKTEQETAKQWLAKRLRHGAVVLAILEQRKADDNELSLQAVKVQVARPLIEAELLQVRKWLQEGESVEQIVKRLKNPR